MLPIEDVMTLTQSVVKSAVNCQVCVQFCNGQEILHCSHVIRKLNQVYDVGYLISRHNMHESIAFCLNH